MGEAAYEQAKAEGSLIEQRLRNLVEMGMAIQPDELSVLSEAADLLEWLDKERDALIHDLERTTANLTETATESERLMADKRRMDYLESEPIDKVNALFRRNTRITRQAVDFEIDGTVLTGGSGDG